MANANTNYIDMKTAKMVDYDRNVPRDDSGGAEGISQTGRFGEGGKIVAGVSNISGGDKGDA